MTTYFLLYDLPVHVKIYVANSMNPDQTAPRGAVWSGSTLFVCMLKLVLDVIGNYMQQLGAQWLGGRGLDLRPRGQGFETLRRHCIVSLSKTH